MSEAKSVFEISVAELLEMNGGLLVTIREELGFSPQEMADRLDCDRSTLNRYENDRIKSIPASLVARVKKLLDEEKVARGVRASPEPDAGEPPVPRAPTFPIALARGPLAAGTRLVETVLSIEPPVPVSRIFVAVEGRGAPTANTFDAASAGAPQGAPPQRASARRRGDSGLRAWAMMTAAIVLCFFTGCFLAHRTAQQKGLGEQDPDRVPEEIYTDEARKENGGAQTGTRRSIPLPKKAYSWQKLAPCQGGETEKVGGCWQRIPDEHPPCPRYAVESEGQCFMPIPAEPKRPSTVTPKK